MQLRRGSRDRATWTLLKFPLQVYPRWTTLFPFRLPLFPCQLERCVFRDPQTSTAALCCIALDNPPVIHSQPAAAPAAAPPVPRSWASLAASNPKKWDAAVNQPAAAAPPVPRSWASLAASNQKKWDVAVNQLAAAPAAAPPVPRSWVSLAASNPKKWGAVNQPAAAPATAPPVPRSWASLAVSNPKKWGAAVNQESRGTTEILSNPVPAINGVPAQAVQSVPATNSSPQTTTLSYCIICDEFLGNALQHPVFALCPLTTLSIRLPLSGLHETRHRHSCATLGSSALSAHPGTYFGLCQ
jgi:hypothetical protein